MAKCVNRVTLIGYLAEDPDCSDSGNGKNNCPY
jgi:single-stranded DNA-binding protein